MHPRRLLPALGLASLLAVAGLAPISAQTRVEPPLLRGILLDGAGTLFSLSDATGSAVWLKLGQSHAGWKLESFDAERQVLVVTRDGERQEIGLEAARIRADASRATTADADALLDQIRFEEMVSKSIELQQEAMMKAMNQMAGAGVSDAEKTRMMELQARMTKALLDEMDLPGMRQDMAKLMSEVFTAEELRAQSAFYSTAAGRATLEKQPMLQSRMAELMMPRMMKAMPKIQAMAQEAAATGKQ
jgi:hypothetical protein